MKGDAGLWARYAKCPMIRNACCINPSTTVQIPIPLEVVGSIERNVHSSSISTTGSAFKAHGHFISLLSTMECEERYKQALCCYAPMAMQQFMGGKVGAGRKLRRGRLVVKPEKTAEEPAKEAVVDVSATDSLLLPEPNMDAKEGMVGTMVDPCAFGKEDRLVGNYTVTEPKVLAYPIGPDLIPTEVMASTGDNLRAGLAKRVQPLPWQADKATVRKIDKTVGVLIKEVFSVEKIVQWRNDNPFVEEFCSSKWSPERFRRAFEEAMSDVGCRIEQTFQIKTNEALPAKGKAPRPIIQCGDRAQVMMSLPVKCFEELLFEYFEERSIKHATKYDAMKRVAELLRQDGANLVEGDGSAWDSCCNPTIRNMTENRIVKYIIDVLGHDPEVPLGWTKKVLADMCKPKIKGKCKTDDFAISPLRVCIESIRQSGHRGTSCFNYLINLVCWLVVMCEHPERMIKKNRDGQLQTKYVSPRDGKEYYLKYAFEGDDSALSSTENLSAHSESIEKLWTQMGFRMKLVYVEDKLTFTGFDFLCNKKGPTGTFVPEIARNIASSSWTTSSLVKSFPHKRYEVGAAAMLARAENFKDCGPLSAYFAALGLAHCKIAGDRGIELAEAKSLAINVSPSIIEELQRLRDSAGAMNADMSKLVAKSMQLTPEQQSRLLHADFGSDPFDTHKARRLIPKSIWDPSKFEKPRR